MNKNKWFIPLLILVAVTFIGFWNLLLLSPIQPFLAADLEISIGKAAQLTTVSAASALVSLVLFGRFGALLPRRFMIRAGVISLCIGSFLLTQTNTYSLMMLFRIFNGIADGIIYPAAWVAVSEYLPSEKRALGISAIIAGTGLSGVIGLPLTSLFINDGDWQSSLWVFLGFAVAVLLLTLSLPKPYQVEQENRRPASQNLILEILFRNRRLRAAAYANIAGDVAWFGALTFIGSFIVRFYQPSLEKLALFFLVASSFFVLGSFLYSSSPNKQKHIAMISSFAVIIMVSVFFSITSSFTLTVILAAFYAFVRAPGIVAMDSLLLDLSEGTMTRVAAGSLTNVITAIGTLIGAAVGGFVLDATTYSLLGVVFSICSFISIFFLFLLNTTQR